METVNYQNVQEQQLQDINRLLTAGYDTQLLQNNWQHKERLINLAEEGLYDRLYSLGEQQLQKFLKQTPEYAYTVMDVALEGGDINRLLDMTLSVESLNHIRDCFPFFDITSILRPEHNTYTAFFIKSALHDGVDFMPYLKYDDSKMSFALWLLREGMEADPEILNRFPADRIKAIYGVCLTFNSAEPAVYVKNNMKLFLRSNPEKIKMLLTGKMLGILEPTAYIHLPDSELFKKMGQLMKDRIREIAKEEAKAVSVNVNTDPQKMDYDSLVKLLLTYRKHNVMLPFLVLYRKNDKRLTDRVQYWLDAGVMPHDCAKLDQLANHVKSFADYDKLALEYVKNTLKLESLPDRPEKEEFMRLIYKLSRLGVDATAFIHHKMSIKELNLLCKLAEKNRMVNTDTIMNWLEVKEKPDNFAVIFSTAVDILLQHNIDLLPYVIKALQTGKKGAKADYIESSLLYIKHALNAVAIKKGEERKEYLQSVEKLLQETAFRSRFFDYRRMREIHKGILSGVDISKYAKFEYKPGVMYIIREGLEQGIDVTAFASQDEKVLRHILRIFRKETPPLTTANVNSNNMLYLVECAVKEVMQQQKTKERAPAPSM